MIQRVIRYELTIGEVTPVRMPADATVVHVAVKPGDDAVSILAVSRMDALNSTRQFKVVGTGWEFEETGHYYVGTALADSYEWHVFEVTT